ncbi:MAG: hypothetical protein WC560_05120 [Syntrophales bacterium]
MYFNAEQILLAKKAFAHAEQLATRYFRTRREKLAYRYDVKTLAYLEDHEVNERAFAHLCKYHYQKDHAERSEPHFYRVCLQDNRILDAVERAHSFIKLDPLMLYIATHEIVHVIRFECGESKFDASQEEKEEEERNVHGITRSILQSKIYQDFTLVLDCFSNRYQI